ncbi:CARDB domain-containing protein [Streptomyces sp. NPDC057499]|uniref:DUF7507 domain-containing protein n=1 Tax=Streptomyces sp. NPDC057499 TaxID=3346150 RepID=UPI00367E8FAF
MRDHARPGPPGGGPATGTGGVGARVRGRRRRAVGWAVAWTTSLAVMIGQGVATGVPDAPSARSSAVSSRVSALPAWQCPPGGPVGYTFETLPAEGEPPATPGPRIMQIDPSSGDVSAAGETALGMDAVGYNPLDEYFYGVQVDDPAHQVLRVGESGVLEPVGIDAPFAPVAGDIDPRGHWWIMSDSGQWAEIDLSPGSPGYGVVIASGDVGQQAPGDWSYMNGPAGTGLYGLRGTTSAPPARLVFFNPDTHTLDDLGPVSGNYPTSLFRATFTDGTYLYGVSDRTLVRIDLGARSATSIGEVPTTQQDGAQCALPAAAANLTLTKRIHGRNHPDDQFKIGVFDDTGNLLTSNTSQDGDDSVTAPPVPVEPGRTYHLFDHLTNDFFPPFPDQYHSQARCTDDTGNELPLEGGPGDWTFRAVRSTEIHCEIDNFAVGQASMELVKEVDRQAAVPGDVLHYTFRVINTGTTVLDHVTVDDPRLGVHFDCGPVLPGEEQECGATDYQVTGQDAEDGAVVNHAHATGHATNGQVTESDSSASVYVLRPSPEISIDKSVDPTTVDAAGDQVTYQYQVINTGASQLHDVVLDEHGFTGTGPLSALSCPTSSLAPGEAMTCTATYTVTQQDIDAGGIDNAATAVATDDFGQVVESPPAQARVEANRNPAINVAKTSDSGPITHPGQEVRYTYTFANTGNTTLSNVQAQDVEFNGHGQLQPLDCGGWDHTLAPGQSVSCHNSYVIEPLDVDQGVLVNTVEATGFTPDGQQVTARDSNTVLIDREPGLALRKSAAPDAPEDFTVGREITYFYEVVNTGNTTVDDIAIDETEFTGSGPKPDVTCPEGSLPAGGSQICTATYTLTQADIDRGTVANTAHATGTSAGDEVTSNTGSVVLEGPPARPGLSLEKSVSPASVDAAGQRVTYSFRVTNTGTTALHGLQIVENGFTGTGGSPEVSCPVTTLAPGAGTTCTAAYTVTQADIDAGAVDNTASAAALAPDGQDVGSERSDSRLTTTGTAGLRVTKTATPGTVWAAGETVSYAFTVTNTGSTTLVAPRIVETAFSGSGGAPAASCPQEPIPPGGNVLCTAGYTVTDADIAAGRITNTAHAVATRADNAEDVTSGNAEAAVGVSRATLAFDKSVSPTSAAAGDTVTYSYKVTNTGNAAVHDLRVLDTAFTGTGALSQASCPVTELAAGASTTCTAVYTVTADDAEAGRVDNTAHATAVNGIGAVVVSPGDSARLTVTGSEPEEGSLDLVKKARIEKKDGGHCPPGGKHAGCSTRGPSGGDGDGTGGGSARPGDIIHWELTVTNTGRTTLHDITVDDPTGGKVTCPKTTLAPGESMTCTVPPHTVTEQDARAGRVTDTAIARALTPDGTEVSSPQATATVAVRRSGKDDHKKSA